MQQTALKRCLHLFLTAEKVDCACGPFERGQERTALSRAQYNLLAAHVTAAIYTPLCISRLLCLLSCCLQQIAKGKAALASAQPTMSNHGFVLTHGHPDLCLPTCIFVPAASSQPNPKPNCVTLVFSTLNL